MVVDKGMNKMNFFQHRRNNLEAIGRPQIRCNDRQQKFQDIFTSVTGMYTSLGTLRA
jgi:hypothetical protein